MKPYILLILLLTLTHHSWAGPGHMAPMVSTWKAHPPPVRAMV